MHMSELTEYSNLIRRLSVSTSDFPQLRKQNRIYVDKTELIYSLACRTEKFFLARPRRFGKSLLVSTLDSLFRHGLRDFSGLAIEKIWTDTTYRVVRLDFLDVKNFDDPDDFRVRLAEMLTDAFAPVGFCPVAELPLLRQLKKWLREQPPSSLVLLIDEYDAPLCACLENTDLFNKIRKQLSEFYAAVKSCSQALRFVFMTGITKFRQTGIFSELNDFTDITLSMQYGALLGYTESELKHSFGFLFPMVAHKLKLTEDALFYKLKEHYDGFCFDNNASIHVFNPWSVMKFLQEPTPKFPNYWIETGGLMTVLLEYIKSHSLRNPAEFQADKSISEAQLSASTDSSNISDLALLTQTGYLTIKKAENGMLRLGYPNREVAASMASLYSELLLHGQMLDSVGAGSVAEVMAHASTKDVVKDFNRMFTALDYLNHPVTDESACRSFLQVMLYGARLYSEIEVHNALGRSDLEVDAGKRRWIFEIKYLPSGTNSTGAKAEKLLTEAVNQIDTRRYGLQNAADKELKRVALVYSAEKRIFTHWQELAPTNA